MMRLKGVLHKKAMFHLKNDVQIEQFFFEKTALFVVFQCNFVANVATSSKRANDAFYMYIT